MAAGQGPSKKGARLKAERAAQTAAPDAEEKQPKAKPPRKKARADVEAADAVDPAPKKAEGTGRCLRLHGGGRREEHLGVHAAGAEGPRHHHALRDPESGVRPRLRWEGRGRARQDRLRQDARLCAAVRGAAAIPGPRGQEGPEADAPVSPVAPTRELARQIFTDFESVGTAAGFVARCFYGGTAFGPQCDDLRAGIDLLVGTPGRLLDHIRRETIDLSACQVLILDEADEMLSMGFQEDVDALMLALPKENVQKMLFSATLPKWVNALVSKHLHEPVWIDVVGNDDTNATNSKITHQYAGGSCPPHMRGDCIGDLCKVHAGFFGKTLVFTDTKKECDELAANEKLAALGAGVLHGDIGQNQREAVMDGFRSGRIKVLVATDVAARGLDVPNVELVVQTHPPSDLDMYVHRAGRTARGGREGTSVTFYSMKEEYVVRLLEHKKGIKMQRVSPPQPSEVVKAASRDAVKQLDHVHQDSVDAFMERAKELIAERGAEVILAASLAALTGHARRLRGRSILSAFEGFTAILLESERGIENTSKGWYLIRSMLPEECREQCKAVQLCNDGKAVIFDAPDELVPGILQSSLWRGCKVSVAKELPDLQQRDCDMESAARQLRDRRQQVWQNIKEKKASERSDGAGGRGKGSGKSGGKAGGRGKGGGAAEEAAAGAGRGRGGGRGGKGGGRGGGRGFAS
ncbi:unnamed protein product [Prorocentrum cordatum]|uniref:RNA helicase n=1 Tax=Prorocentrum cordatum TaxID=2364126 RepID=A0ABN9TC46_9DINO|nr:unnamed protein product [Polarella glacialis]